MVTIPYIRNSEYSGDLFSVLFSERIIFITEDITKELATLLVAELMYLDSQNDDDITIQICSNGGDVDACNMILDTMNTIRSDVVTINMGAAYSCAALILLSGTPGKRYAFKNSRVLLHQPLVGMNGWIQTTDLEIKTNELIKTKRKTRDLIVEKTNMTAETVDGLIERDTYFSAEEALTSGIIDKIM